MNQGIATSGTGAVAREERCAVLYVRVADGVSAEQGYAIRDELNIAKTNGWWFLNPGGFTIFFAGANRAERANTCRASLVKLGEAHPSWPIMSFGLADGVIFGAFTIAGILESMPLGAVINDAMLAAVGNARAIP